MKVSYKKLLVGLVALGMVGGSVFADASSQEESFSINVPTIQELGVYRSGEVMPGETSEIMNVNFESNDGSAAQYITVESSALESTAAGDSLAYTMGISSIDVLYNGGESTGIVTAGNAGNGVTHSDATITNSTSGTTVASVFPTAVTGLVAGTFDLQLTVPQTSFDTALAGDYEMTVTVNFSSTDNGSSSIE